MASSPENISMALFCDFENVALGVRDAKYDKFDIKPVLERLLLKGSIVVKKAYCDWDRYKTFKGGMHEANFELIEIPHVRQSGKNSADIRMVVDALDLCYTKSHVNTFVIISGDSDFSPLVSKLRENAKQVIGVGIKQSTSDLLVANCDEFIFYDDLVRENRRTANKREAREVQPAAKRSPDEEGRRKEELEARKSRAIDMAVETFDALIGERGDSGKIWASVLKQAIKRRKPDFNEASYGFRTFGNLLEEAHKRGLLECARDEKSGTYIYRSDRGSAMAAAEPVVEAVVKAAVEPFAEPVVELVIEPVAEPVAKPVAMPPLTPAPAPFEDLAEATDAATSPVDAQEPETVGEAPAKRKAKPRTGRRPARKKAEIPQAPSAAGAPESPETPRLPETQEAPVAVSPAEPSQPDQSVQPASAETAGKPARKTATRGRRPRKPAVPQDNG